MFMKRLSFILLIVFIFIQATSAQIPHTISYQGILTDAGGTPVADGNYNLTFKLYNVSTGGSALWTESQEVTVANGIFNVILGRVTPLNLAFDRIYWLGITVGSGSELTPRIEMTSSAYSLQAAAVADSCITSVNIADDQVVKSINSLKDDVTLAEGSNISITPSGNTLTIAASVSGGGNTLDQAYDQGGGGAGRVIIADSGAFEIGGTDGVVFTGTYGSGSIPAEGSGVRMMWYPAKAAFRAGSVGSEWNDTHIGDWSAAMGYCTTAQGWGSFAMGIYPAASGDGSTAMGIETIASEEASFAVGTGSRASGHSATAMGYVPTASGEASMAMGYETTASGIYSTAMGEVSTASGSASTAMGVSTTASGDASTAMGHNTEASGGYSLATGWESRAIGNGSIAVGNLTTASGDDAVAMGFYNIASGNESIAMGDNSIASGASAATIGSGLTASGSRSVAMIYCSAARGNNSFAVGSYAKANHRSSIVIAANASLNPGDSVFTGGDEQLVLRANGGMYITNTSGQAPYETGRLINTSSGAYLTTGGTWTNSSDKNLKENFTSVNTTELLDKLKAIRITQWNYKSEDPDIKHIGPVAQDFYATFGLGNNDKSISTIDPAGVALAAIQELEKRTSRLKMENESLKEKIALLEAALKKLENLMNR
jgi:hypothetical protein